MRMEDAMSIIKKGGGYMVSFEWCGDGFLRGDHFPDKHGGESLIETEEEAWKLASGFASSSVGRVCNIYVIDSNFSPVSGHESKKILNR